MSSQPVPPVPSLSQQLQQQRLSPVSASPSVQVISPTPPRHRNSQQPPHSPLFRTVSPASARHRLLRFSPIRLRPQWARRRPRHFDSSPENPTVHCLRCDTDKSVQEFSRENEPLCNECRQQLVY